MVTRVRVRDIGAEEGTRLLHIVRRCSGSVVTWRRAQMVLLSAQGMDVGAIATVTFASDDRVRHGNQDRFESLQPRYAGGRPPKVHPVAAAGDEEDRAVSMSRAVSESDDSPAALR